MYYLGIDAGGTKCSARLTDKSGAIIGTGLSGPANMRLGVDTVFNSIMACSTQAIAQAGLDETSTKKIRAGMGIAGIGRKGAQEELTAKGFPFAKTSIDSDANIANLGAHSGGDGGTVTIGTGSIAIGRVGGKNIRMGGYGFPISDEGSGAYIGLQAIRITLRASDGRVDHSDLTKTLFDKYGRETAAIVDWMDIASATEYAVLAPMVVEAAEAGDFHGRLITNHSAWHIEMMIRGLYKVGIERCTLAGGLAPRLEPWLAPDIRMKLVPPYGDTLDGALWLARQS